VNLSTSELTQLRADAGDYLPDTCTIQVPTRTLDADGGWSTSWANTYTSVACRLAPVSARQSERLEGDQLTAVTEWVLTVAHNQTADTTYRVVHDSTTYEVVRIEDKHSNRTARRVYLRRLD